MGVDGASSHVSKDLVVPKNMRLLRLPPYAPELNPQEHVWDELREKEFPNRVYGDMAGVRVQLEVGLPRLAADHRALRSLTAWPWIDGLVLNAHLRNKRATALHQQAFSRSLRRGCTREKRGDGPLTAYCRHSISHRGLTFIADCAQKRRA
jgi:hypothetical protein